MVTDLLINQDQSISRKKDQLIDRLRCTQVHTVCTILGQVLNGLLVLCGYTPHKTQGNYPLFALIYHLCGEPRSQARICVQYGS